MHLLYSLKIKLTRFLSPSWFLTNPEFRWLDPRVWWYSIIDEINFNYKLVLFSFIKWYKLNDKLNTKLIIEYFKKIAIYFWDSQTKKNISHFDKLEISNLKLLFMSLLYLEIKFYSIQLLLTLCDLEYRVSDI